MIEVSMLFLHLDKIDKTCDNSPSSWRSILICGMASRTEESAIVSTDRPVTLMTSLFAIELLLQRGLGKDRTSINHRNSLSQKTFDLFQSD